MAICTVVAFDNDDAIDYIHDNRHRILERVPKGNCLVVTIRHMFVDFNVVAVFTC
jgi:hypothetical protein